MVIFIAIGKAVIKSKKPESDLDYKEIGLRVGIEIHQRLDTNKLFCSCSSKQKMLQTSEVLRKLRAVPGELGNIDPAALHEFLKGKEYIYKLSPQETCLVELDDEPPHNVNSDALKITIQVCKLLDCEFPDESYIMRKTVIDGSNTGGFQRTTILGVNGEIKLSFGKVQIQTVCLEEESARIEQQSEGKIFYKLNGLGIPLVEIATGTVETPEQALELAKALGLLLRSTKVQRGIGSIRQDVNISIKNGERIEIKGFQELEDIPKLIENEARRQIALLEIKKEITRRGSKITESRSDEAILDVTDIFKSTKNDRIRKAILEDGKVYAVFLPDFAGLLKTTCGHVTFGKELSNYAAAFGLGIIHTDEDLAKYKLITEFENIKQKLQQETERKKKSKGHLVHSAEDAIAITVGKLPNVKKAAEAVFERAKLCPIGVPKETRVADNLGSKYTRPLPGTARMYPETDVQPIQLTKGFLDSIEPPKPLTEKLKDLQKVLPKQLAEQIIHSPYYPWYEDLAKDHDPTLVATTFLETMVYLRRENFDIEKLELDDLHEVLGLVTNKIIPKDSLRSAMIDKINGLDKEKIAQKYQQISDSEILKIIKESLQIATDKREQAIMGLVMQKVRGKASGERVVHLLREELARPKRKS